MEQLPFPLLPALAGGLTISREDRGDGRKSFWPLLFPPPSSGEMTEKPLPPSLPPPPLLALSTSPGAKGRRPVERRRGRGGRVSEDASVSAPPSPPPLLRLSSSRGRSNRKQIKRKERGERGLPKSARRRRRRRSPPFLSSGHSISELFSFLGRRRARPQASSSALSPSSPRFPREIPK